MDRMVIIGFTLILLFQAGSCQYIEEDGRGDLKCIEKFCVPENYKKHIGPFKETGHMEILVDFDIAQVVEINDVKFSIKVLMYIGLTWVDHRFIGPGDSDMNSWIPVDADFTNHIWLPDLYIYDLKEIVFPKYYKPFSGRFSVNIERY